MSFSRNDLELLINVPKGALVSVDDPDAYRAFVQALYALECVSVDLENPIDAEPIVSIVRLLWEVHYRDGGVVTNAEVAVARAHQINPC